MATTLTRPLHILMYGDLTTGFRFYGPVKLDDALALHKRLAENGLEHDDYPQIALLRSGE